MNQTQRTLWAAKEKLKNNPDADVSLKYLIEELSGLSYSIAILNDFFSQRPDLIEVFENHCARLQKNEPIQYILGYAYFYGLKIKVSPHTLIPRPETEELIELIANENSNPNMILDLCTGSGCIALGLSKSFPQCMIHGVDISSGAIAIANQNAHLLDCNNILFYEKDIFEVFDTNEGKKYDIIVSNPPYVALNEKHNMSPSVVNYEPHLALFVQNNNPWVFYKRILEIAPQLLNENGKIYAEINPLFANDLQALAAQHHFKSNIIKDLSGKNRFWKVHF
jgi:release factor glutamine methyltransferase